MKSGSKWPRRNEWDSKKNTDCGVYNSNQEGVKGDLRPQTEETGDYTELSEDWELTLNLTMWEKLVTLKCQLHCQGGDESLTGKALRNNWKGGIEGSEINNFSKELHCQEKFLKIGWKPVSEVKAKECGFFKIFIIVYEIESNYRILLIFCVLGWRHWLEKLCYLSIWRISLLL